MTEINKEILLVEDELDIADLVEQALSESDRSITHAGSVTEALGLIESATFDVAVLDIELRDGLVTPVADKLADLGIPYVFASAVYDQVVPARHRHAPFVPKPFQIDKLKAEVQRALERRSMPRSARST
ncbi:response regulator [Stenotrophomonas bentonitica]|uniref:response regulator n=1 Tax=Stenotrophomonas bentonitica TaxID=1450134 RepID=UPI00345E74CF